MKRLLLIVLPLLLIVGCSKVEGKQDLIPFVEKKENGSIEITYYKKTQNGIERVKYEGYYKDGQKKKEGNYKDGKQHGKWTEWYSNGQKKSEGTFKGVVDRWGNTKKDGVWTYWYENGQKKYEVTYKDGKQHGKYIEWYSNGQKKVEGRSLN